MKSLVRWYDETLKDTKQVKEYTQTVDEGLKQVRLPAAHW